MSDTPFDNGAMRNGATDDTLVRVEQLVKVYEDKESVPVRALDGIDLSIRRGEFAAIAGPSGSGKTTLLNIVGGLDRPTSGTLMYKGTELSAAEEEELTLYRRHHVGFVFQLYNLIPSLTARENVSLVSEIALNPMRPEAALGLVGLANRVDHFPAQLSGGEQQRVAIARAVAKQPDLLLCDEPTGALDAETGKLVLAVLDQVNRETDTTTVIITHNVAIAGMGDRVIRMTSGEIAEVTVNQTRADIQEIEW